MNNWFEVNPHWRGCFDSVVKRLFYEDKNGESRMMNLPQRLLYLKHEKGSTRVIKYLRHCGEWKWNLDGKSCPEWTVRELLTGLGRKDLMVRLVENKL